MYSFNHQPLIFRPTRVTSHSASLIDNIFTNINNVKHGDVILMDLSDHFPVFALFGNTKPTLIKREVTFRKYSNNNMDNFKVKLSEVDWGHLYEASNTNEAYTIFSSTFSDLYNQCFPVKTKSFKHYHDENRPWLTVGIITSCRTKNKLYYRYTRNPTPNNFQRYKEFKRILASLIKQAEKTHYRTVFQSSTGNIKATWKIINNILKRKKSCSSLPDEFLIDGRKVNNNLDIANKFNEFFSQIGNKLNSKITPSSKSSTEYLNNLPIIQSELHFSEPHHEEILKLLSNLQDKSASLDEIKPAIVRYTKLELVEPLHYI